MNVERTEWSIQQHQKGYGWVRRGLPYPHEQDARTHFNHLTETFPDRTYRLVNTRWYTDSRIVEGGDE